MHMVKHSEYILKLFISVYLNQMFLFECFPFLLIINKKKSLEKNKLIALTHYPNSIVLHSECSNEINEFFKAV